MTEHQVDAEEYENIEWRDTNHIRNHNQTTSMEDMRYQFGVTKDGKQIEALFEGPKAGMVLRFSPNEARKMASDLLIATEVATDHAKQETQ